MQANEESSVKNQKFDFVEGRKVAIDCSPKKHVRIGFVSFDFTSFGRFAMGLGRKMRPMGTTGPPNPESNRFIKQLNRFGKNQ